MSKEKEKEQEMSNGMKLVQIPIDENELNRAQLQVGEILLITMPNTFTSKHSEITEAFEKVYPNNKIIMSSAKIKKPKVEVIHPKS